MGERENIQIPHSKAPVRIEPLPSDASGGLPTTKRQRCFISTAITLFYMFVEALSWHNTVVKQTELMLLKPTLHYTAPNRVTVYNGIVM